MKELLLSVEHLSWRLPMCDYSLQSIASRPARVGDKLITRGFFGTLSRGFAALSEPGTAVCLLAGTELAFEQEAERGGFFGRFRPQGLGKLARFTQINLDQPNAYHDALEFPDGRILLVTRLKKNQRLTVLQLPAISGGGHLFEHNHYTQAIRMEERDPINS